MLEPATLKVADAAGQILMAGPVKEVPALRFTTYEPLGDLMLSRVGTLECFCAQEFIPRRVSDDELFC